MSATHPDFCGGCNKPIMTDHPFNLCPDCDLRLEKQLARERAWERAPLSKRIAIRMLQGSAIVLGFACGSLLLWVLEPSFYRLVNHLWPLLTLIGTFAGGYFSCQKAKEWKRKITESEPVVSWYQRRRS